MQAYHNQIPLVALDSLPASRIANALALRRFLNYCPRLTFVEGSESAAVLNDLANAGAVRVTRYVHRGLHLAEVSTR